MLFIFQDKATPLIGAISAEDEEMVQLFLEYNANSNIQADVNT